MIRIHEDERPSKILKPEMCVDAVQAMSHSVSLSMQLPPPAAGPHKTSNSQLFNSMPHFMSSLPSYEGVTAEFPELCPTSAPFDATSSKQSPSLIQKPSIHQEMSTSPEKLKRIPLTRANVAPHLDNNHLKQHVQSGGRGSLRENVPPLMLPDILKKSNSSLSPILFQPSSSFQKMPSGDDLSMPPPWTTNDSETPASIMATCRTLSSHEIVADMTCLNDTTFSTFKGKEDFTQVNRMTQAISSNIASKIPSDMCTIPPNLCTEDGSPDKLNDVFEQLPAINMSRENGHETSKTATRDLIPGRSNGKDDLQPIPSKEASSAEHSKKPKFDAVEPEQVEPMPALVRVSSHADDVWTSTISPGISDYFSQNVSGEFQIEQQISLSRMPSNYSGADSLSLGTASYFMNNILGGERDDGDNDGQKIAVDGGTVFNTNPSHKHTGIAEPEFKMSSSPIKTDINPNSSMLGTISDLQGVRGSSTIVDSSVTLGSSTEAPTPKPAENRFSNQKNVSHFSISYFDKPDYALSQLGSNDTLIEAPFPSLLLSSPPSEHTEPDRMDGEL